MNNPRSSESTVAQSSDLQKLPGPWRCLSGSLIAGGIAIALYFLTTSIAESFATKPIHSHNPVAMSISATVRTLVLGMSTMATALFSLVAIGLIALAIQILIQGSRE